ncbi:hypothetical protein [uncultured Roseobacter sp.]|uniref:hypothetical protein n=1 Tax=uncultured Roseobacter sp. TaxID=114847 RepID=UPI0026109666|nr:hypothetical protein [uncultured Roseobacter sp.]
MLSWYQNGACSNKRPGHRRRLTRAHRGTGALLILCTVGVVVRAQETGPPGLAAGFDVTQRLEYSDNPDLRADGDPDFFGRTVLDFTLDSVRTVDRLTFNLGTDIEEGREDQSSLDPTNARVGLNYDRDTRNARIGVDFRYRESDTGTSSIDDDFDQDGDVINQDSGTRENYTFGLEGAVGREAPIGASFNWTYNELTFSGTNNPNLTDQSTNSFSGQVDFRITPRVTANLTGRYIDFDTGGNGVDRETTGLGAGVVLDISPVLTADLSLGYDRIERSGTQSGTDEGLNVDVGLLRTLQNGSLGLNFASDVSSNDDGRRSSLNVSRELELPRGFLALTVGVTGAGVVGTDPLVDVDYRYELPRAVLSFGLSQSVVTDTDNDEDINTTLRANYDQEINSVSSIGLGLSFFNRNELQEDGNDGQRLDIDLTYRHDLTRDWGLVGGFSHSLSTQDNAEDRRSNTVFVGLQRSFDWRP